MPEQNVLDNLDLTNNTPQKGSNLSYPKNLNTETGAVRPPAGLLKQILSQSKESNQFSPYERRRVTKPVKIQKTATPAPQKVEPTPIISENILQPIVDQSIQADADLRTAVENTVSKKFRTGVMPEDVYRTNLVKGVQEGDFKITEDTEGNKEIIRAAPTVLQAMVDGWNGYWDGIKKSLSYYNPLVSDEEKIREREADRRYMQMVIEEEASKAREYGGLAGQTAAQLTSTFLPIGEAAVAAKVAKVGMDAIKISTANSALQAVTGALSQGNQAEEEAYNIARDKGLSEQEAYDISKANRFTYLSSGALEGVVSTLADAQIGKAFTAATKKAGEGFLNATKAYLQKAKEPGLSLAIDASVAGLMSGIRDLSTEAVTGQDLNVLERAWDNAKGELIAGGAIATIASAGGATARGIDKWYKSQATNYLSTLDKTFVENEFKDRVEKGLMTEEQMKSEMQKIEEWNKIRKENPTVPEEKQPTIYGLILAKKDLTEAFKNADESNQADVLQKINEIDNKIQEANTNPDPLAGEVDEEGVKVPEIKTQENATTISEGQEVPTTSGVSQYQGTEGVQDQATNEADNRNRPIGSETQQEVVPESFNNEQGVVAWNTVQRVIEDSRSRGRDEKTTQQNARVNLEKSKAFELADDVTRNKMITDMNKQLFGKNAKAAPSVTAILGNVKNKLDITEAAALKRLFKRQEQASRETSSWIKNTRQNISNGLKELASKGTIKTAQLQTILNKYDALNLSNNDSVDKFVKYTSGVINDANYAKKLSDANGIKDRIKKYSKSKNAQQNLSVAAKSFLGINPEDVQDIDKYIKAAQSVEAGLRPSRATGLEVNFNQPFDKNAINAYTEQTKAEIDAAVKESKLAEYQDLVDAGVISSDMNFDEMEEIITAIEETGEKDDMKDKQRYIRAYVNKRFNTLSALAKSLGFPSQFGDFKNAPTDADKQRISDLLKVGIADMKIEDAYRAVEALQNFVTNGESSGLDAVLHSHYGYKNAEFLAKQGFKARAIKFLFSKPAGKAMFENFTTLPVFYDAIFGNDRAARFKEAMGLTGIENGRAKAVKMIQDIENQYLKKFSKSEPNRQEFLSQENVFERGMYAFVKRNFGLGDAQNQKRFEERKAIAKQNIDRLLSGSEQDIELGNLYLDMYNKILAESNNIEEVAAKVNPKNREAVEWWTGQFNKFYPELRDVSLNVYNQELNADNNYNPDILKNMNDDSNVDVDPFQNGAFASFADNVPTKKSGTLMKTVPYKELPAGKYIDFNFDYNNVNAMEKALTDIYTAKYIRQAKSFLNSNNHNKLFSSKEDADLSRRRVASYVKRTRGLDRVDPTEFGKFRQMFNELSRLVVSRSLGSVFQPLKQTVPALTNTLINAGGYINFSDNNNPDVRDFINRSGRAIASRGIESDALIESNDKLLLNAQKKGGFDKTLNGIKKLNEAYLKNLVAKPDGYAARLSFMAYYRQALQDQGIDPSKVDWKSHQINDNAADYAQHMVDLQQNVTDRNLQGEIMASRDSKVVFMRNMVMPLANFIMNQKARMYSDFVNATSKTNTSQDKARARRSLIALSGEMIMYNAILYSSQLLMNTVADSLSGIEPSEEEKKKREKDAARTTMTNIVNDIISPFPLLNIPIDAGINNLMNATFQSDTPEDLRFNLYSGEGRKWYDDLGLTGMGIKKVDRTIEMARQATTGDVVKSYFGKEYVKNIADQDLPMAKAAAVLNALTQVGLLPTDVGSVANKMMKGAEKRSMNATKEESYREIRGEGATEIDPKSKNINADISRVVSITDPEAKANYLIKIAKKYGGQALSDAINSISEMETASGKSPINNVIDDATNANLEAILTKDPIKTEMARLFSLKDQKARAYKMMELRDKMPKEDFYNTLKWAMGYNLLNDNGLAEFGSRLSKKVGTDSEEFKMALSAVEE